ncbi:MAG: molybdopterin oxidoreductase [Bdellovibrio sp.]|jgi:hypothetical protein
MAAHSHAELVVKKFVPSQTLKIVAVVMTVIGVLAFGVGLLMAPDRVWPAYLTAFFYVSCLSLGGMFWIMINHIAKAGWSTSIRRIAEGMTAFFPVILVGSLVLVFGLSRLYIWTDADAVAASYLLKGKTAYLNTGFLIVRLLIFGIGMLIFGRMIVGNSLKQDSSGDHSLTHKNVALSVGCMVFFALSFSLFSVDLLMSLLPTWYSTIFGIYCFAGMFQSSLAFFILILMYMKKYGYIQGYYSVEHIHDVAKYLKGFTIFWAYIAFSQFMLIWYANIPEETEYYLMRAQNGWMGISMALLIFKFVVPFLALLPRAWKRNEKHLLMVCILVLVMQYIDVHWMVYPNFNQNHFTLGVWEIGLLVGFLGIFLLTMMRFFQKHSTVAIKDPRLEEALNHHVTY